MIKQINYFLNKDKFLYLIIFLFSIYSILISNYQAIHVYDGFHWGFVSSSAQDFLNNKIPYKESFIHYGILTTIIHSIFYSITNSVISIFFFTSILYVLSIIFVTLIIKKFTNNNYCYLFIYLIFFFQPFTVYPWHTYLVYFFLSLGLYIYFNKTLFSYFFFGLVIQLIYLISDSSKFFTYIIFLITILFIILENKKNYLKFLTLFVLGYSVPLLIFLISLYFQGNFDNWLAHDITGIFLKFEEKSLYILIWNFILNLTNNFYKYPEYIIYIIINLSCLFFIYFHATKKLINYDILFISLISLFLNYILLHALNSFRIFSSLVFGLIVLSFLLFRTEKNFLKELIILFLVLMAPLANPFEKGEANRIYFSKFYSNNHNNLTIKQFKFMNFRDDVYLHYEELLKNINLVKSNCKQINKFYNLTSDHYYYLILSDYFKTDQIIPGYNERYLSRFYNGFVSPIDINFYPNLRDNIKNENVILIRDKIYDNKLNISGNKIDLKDYIYIKLPYSYDNKFKRIYIPKKCFNNIN